MGLPFCIFKHALSILILSIPKEPARSPTEMSRVGLWDKFLMRYTREILLTSIQQDPPVVVLCCLQYTSLIVILGGLLLGSLLI